MFGDDEPIQVWRELDEAGLRSWAAQYVGWATTEMSPPDLLRWTLEERQPLELFRQTSTDWEAFYQDEIVRGGGSDPSFADLEFHSPVVISIEGGGVIIWDGWHRLACAIHRGDQTIMAIVGTEISGTSS
ncbi:hypothetical protein [Sphingomonas sp. 3-13AW]|uniref:hypothetical protein n=1 Tax=Sphingomonas sp. 3-13AW TaxID=3050450 RepID=UPI003BB6AE44